MNVSGKPAGVRDVRRNPPIKELNACCDEIEKFFADLRRKYGHPIVNYANELSEGLQAM
jgi:hypothetical protein